MGRLKKLHFAGAAQKLLLSLSVAVLLWSTTGGALAQTALSQASAAAKPARSCDSLKTVAISERTDNVRYTVDTAVEDPATATAPATCKVTVSTTHPPAGDDVNIWIWLPVNTWNGRFMGTGGGGYVGGSVNSLSTPVSQGYAAGATDTGHTVADGSFALNPDRSLNWQLMQDTVLGIHEMTVAGKALVKAFYGKEAKYSYFNGCSTGGRQGITEAQRYPADYDGVLAGAPAINVTTQRVIGIWGQMVMQEAGNFLPQCKFEAANAAAIQACDKLDGVTDGVIGDPRKCTYSPQALVGSSTPCGTITQADANVIAKIWQGPRDTEGNFIWYGLTRGSSFATLNGTRVVDGQLVGNPSTLTLDGIRYFLLQNPDWDWRTLTLPQFEQLLTQSTQQYGLIFGDNPDLSPFRKNGGKLLMWHGWSDQLILPEGSIHYYDRVVKAMGGLEKTQDFARLFMAPGVGHCGGGTGSQPTGQLQALIDWVERGKAPQTLLAEKRDATNTVIQTRPLCAYPQAAVYKGQGSTDVAANFVCKKP